MRRIAAVLVLIVAMTFLVQRQFGRNAELDARVAESMAALSASSSSAASPAAARPTGSVTQAPPDIPILVYHHVRDPSPYDVSTWNYKMSVSASAFARQMQWLKDNGYTTIDLDTYAAIMTRELPAPAKPIVITFDDNHLSQYELAFPILKANGQMAVFYIITDRIDRPTVLSSAQITEMSAAGMDIQSHTLAHRVLTALPPEEVERDLRESRKVLEELLGKPVRHLAYPGTAHDETVRNIAKKTGYLTATIMDPRVATAADDFFRLPRIMVTETTDLARVLP